MAKLTKQLTAALLVWLGVVAVQQWYRLAQNPRGEGAPPLSEEPSFADLLKAVEDSLQREAARALQTPGAAPAASVPADLILTPLARGAVPPAGPPLAGAQLPAPPPPGTQYAVTVKGGVYLRAQANRDSDHRAALSAGIYVKATGNQQRDASGNLWYEVDAGGPRGWVLATTAHGTAGWVAPQPYGVQYGNGGRDNPALARDNTLHAVPVRPGDTFSRLARDRENLGDAVKRNNHINDPQQLRIHDRLYFKNRDGQPRQPVR
jgi:hypothetical protein